MESVENKIISKMKKCGRGSVFFVNDFLAYGTRSAVNKALERMVLQGTILRAARGIYCYPKLEKVYGLGAIPPSTEDIAAAVAKRDGAHIVPSGAFAQYQLGLTQKSFSTACMGKPTFTPTLSNTARRCSAVRVKNLFI